MEKAPPSSWLATVSLADLHAMRRRLAAEIEGGLARLDALEAQKTAFDQEGAARHSLRQQQALARQVADLDRQAELQSRLLRFIVKQQRLLERLIGLRESAERWEALRAAAPAAVELGWADLAAAAADLAETGPVSLAQAEGRLDQMLRILGVPEEEWPSARPSTSAGAPGRAVERSPDEPPQVAEVLDGRTVRLATGEMVRYIGVDAPLLRGPLGRPDAGAEEAYQANRRLVEGQYVRLEADAVDRDPDGALWRYVWVGQVCANAELIRQGYAYHLPLSPNLRHSDWLARLEGQARRKKKGVWG